MNRKMNYLLVAMLLLPSVACTQEVVAVRGRVSANGRAVPYATLQLQGTSIGVACNDIGEYELKLPVGYADDTVVVRKSDSAICFPVC